MAQKKIFVTGISTEVGKTIASAILVEALQADYWKPIQAGDLEYSDTDKVKELISNSKSNFYPNAYTLKSPMSPHAAAEIDGVEIDLKKIQTPKTENTLIIEGAGGLLVPLNEKETILDIITTDYEVILVSRHYLGSINHTLLSIKMLEAKGLNISLIYSGEENKTTEEIINKMTNIPVLGRINEEDNFDKETIKKYALIFKGTLNKL